MPGTYCNSVLQEALSLPIEEVINIREGQEIGYKRSKTIELGSWEFLIIRLFFAYQANNQRYDHTLASEAECKERVD